LGLTKPCWYGLPREELGPTRGQLVPSAMKGDAALDSRLAQRSKGTSGWCACFPGCTLVHCSCPCHCCKPNMTRSPDAVSLGV
jgi:hypothetical protein